MADGSGSWQPSRLVGSRPVAGMPPAEYGRTVRRTPERCPMLTALLSFLELAVAPVIAIAFFLFLLFLEPVRWLVVNARPLRLPTWFSRRSR